MSGVYADDNSAQVGFAIFLSVLVVIDLLGNTLVILIILTNQSMRSAMNYLLVNLAVSDIMVGIFIAPIYIFNHFYTHPGGLAGRLLCSMLTGGNVAWVAQISSCLSLVAISIERYFAIMHPFSVKYRLSTIKVKRMVIVSWICAVIFNTPFYFIVDYDHRNSCLEQWPESKPWLSITYSLAWLVLAGIVPIAIMFVLYSKVIYTLWFKQNQVQGTQLAMLRSRKRVTKMVVTVSVIYVICIVPNLIMYVIDQFKQIQNHLGNLTYIFTFLLTVCNSAINPFIYTLQSTTFRRHLMKLTCCTSYRSRRKNRLDIQRVSSLRSNEQDMSIRLTSFTNELNIRRLGADCQHAL